MRFLALMIPGNTKDYEKGVMPDPKLIETMMKYERELSKAGVRSRSMVSTSSAKSARIRFGGAKRTVTDGPFTETRELIGGRIWQVEVEGRGGRVGEALPGARRRHDRAAPDLSKRPTRARSPPRRRTSRAPLKRNARGPQ
jgi:hypothetical protein